MAGLGAMTIGLIGGGIAWLCFITFTCLLAAVIFIDAYRHKMKAVLWCVMALLFNFYSLPVYIYVRIKMANIKCESCGEKVGQKKNFCPVCGTEVPKFDDGAFAKKVIKYVLIAVAAFSVLGSIYVALTGIINY